MPSDTTAFLAGATVFHLPVLHFTLLLPVKSTSNNRLHDKYMELMPVRSLAYFSLLIPMSAMEGYNTSNSLSIFYLAGTARRRSSCHGPPTTRPCVSRSARLALVADQAED